MNTLKFMHDFIQRDTMQHIINNFFLSSFHAMEPRYLDNERLLTDGNAFVIFNTFLLCNFHLQKGNKYSCMHLLTYPD